MLESTSEKSGRVLEIGRVFIYDYEGRRRGIYLDLPPEKSSKYFSISIILLLTRLVWKSIENLKLLQIYRD